MLMNPEHFLIHLFTVCFLFTTSTALQPASLTQNAFYFNAIYLDLDTGITFTWQAVDNTPNITVYHSTDITVTLQEQANGQLMIKGRTIAKPNNSAEDRHGSGLVLMLFALITPQLIGFHGSRRKFGMIFVLLFCVLNCISYDVPDISSMTVHIWIPIRIIKQICIKDQCTPVLCPLSYVSALSSVPSNSPLFDNQNNCTLKQPDRWNEWLRHYFGNGSDMQDYFGDVDGDGLVNILEYYGLEAFGSSPYNESSFNHTRSRRAANQEPVQSIGTDPTNPDSDNDRLLDGFEVQYSLNPKVGNPASADYDGDTIDNLNEQIHGTNPIESDTDGDGVSDGQEIEQGGDPGNPRDNGEGSSEVARVRLTVGDHSGSHSERYILHVGSISHQSPGFGVVGSGDYDFRAGTYDVRIQHVDSILEEPDYDYTATLTKVDGSATVEIVDPQRILGVHDESEPFYASGRSAQMIVTGVCTDLSTTECKCARRTSCSVCVSDDSCSWSIKKKTCLERCLLDWIWQSDGTNMALLNSFSSIDPLYALDPSQCPCSWCQRWYDQERTDKRWLQQLNSQIPCPCQIKQNLYWVDPIDQSRSDWGTDIACHGGIFASKDACAEFHPGSAGCLRSEKYVGDARQQCCYDANNRLITAGLPGAGTPDKSNSLFGHYSDDVESFAQCCKYCDEANYCNYYIGDVRKGDSSHCP